MKGSRLGFDQLAVTLHSFWFGCILLNFALFFLNILSSDHETDSTDPESYQTDDTDINFIPPYII